MSTVPAAPRDLGAHDWLARIVSEVGNLVKPKVGNEPSPATRIDVIRLLEQLKAATEAAQAAEIVRFADAHADQRGLADQIALACAVAPSEGSRRLGTARALVRDLPETMAALRRGDVAAETAQLVAAETSHLDATTRRAVDQVLHGCTLTGFSTQQIGRHVRRLAYEADPVAAVERGRRARSQRRVTLRRARDTMAMLTGVLPAEQGVACWEALRRHADQREAAGDARSHGAILADTLVERITGQVSAPAVAVEVNLVVPVETLIDAGSARSGELSGYGPMPAEVIRDLFTDTPARRWWRRVFTAPAGGVQRAVSGVTVGVAASRADWPR